VEEVSPRCCSVFRSGDLDELEHAVRDLVGRILREGNGEIRAVARREAVRLFAPGSVAEAVASCLRSAANPFPGIHGQQTAAR
nr:hypothetical protein [Actinomycetota bacterium]